MTRNIIAPIGVPGEKVLRPLLDLLANKKILLIGSNEVDEMLIRFMVESNEGRLEVENEASSAQNKIEHGQYDLVLMNTRLNKLNAMQLVQSLKSNAKRDIPIIGLTSKDLNGRGLFSGFDYIMKRPVEKKKFHRALDAVFPA